MPQPQTFARATGPFPRIAEPFSQRARARRLEHLLRAARITRDTRIVDIGCGGLGLIGLAPELSIVGVDLEDRPEYPGRLIRADVADGLPFDENEFDLAYSNSVIEHVPPDRREAFARELRRVARGWYVQTPAISFPVEPHSLLPFAHWLPERVRRRYWKFGAGSDPDEIKLLRRGELERLFGPASRERFGPFTKSWIALRLPAPKR